MKPVARPNRLYQQILSSMLSDHALPQPRLARNVSWDNVDRMSRRWIR